MSPSAAAIAVLLLLAWTIAGFMAWCGLRRAGMRFEVRGARDRLEAAVQGPPPPLAPFRALDLPCPGCQARGGVGEYQDRRGAWAWYCGLCGAYKGGPIDRPVTCLECPAELSAEEYIGRAGRCEVHERRQTVRSAS